MMNKNIKYSLLMILWVVTHGLYAQSLQELESRHGFQDIKLDALISDYPALIYKKSLKNKRSDEPILLYEREKGTYRKIGDVPIKLLEVKTFLKRIIEIRIATPKETDIMKALKSLYGEPYFSVRANAWEWQSEGVVLSLISTGKNKIEITYTSRKLNQYIKEYEEDGVEKISSDFVP
jgi:hypothetical protein